MTDYQTTIHNEHGYFPLSNYCQLEGDILRIENCKLKVEYLFIDILTNRIRTIIIRNINCQVFRIINYSPSYCDLELENLPHLSRFEGGNTSKIIFRSDMPSLYSLDVCLAEIIGLSLLKSNFKMRIYSYNKCLSVINLYKRGFDVGIIRDKKHNFEFINYKSRLGEALEIMKFLLLKAKIKRRWNLFFYCQTNNKKINRFCLLSHNK